MNRPDAMLDDRAAAHKSLGVELALAGRHDEAIESFERAIARDPNDAETRNNLGLSLFKVGRVREAAQSFHAAIDTNPDYIEAWSNWSDLQAALGRVEDAIFGYQETARRDPANAQIHFRLGVAQRRGQMLEDSIVSLREAIRLQPDYAEAHTSLGNSLVALGRRDQAETHFREAVRLNPNLAEAHNNWGILLSGKCKIEDALASYERALALKPDYPDARLNRGILRLLKGDFERGWPDYEWRLHRTGAQSPRFAQPTWDGAALEGRTILLVADQGYGDTIQFIRYAPIVRDRGGRVIVNVQDPLFDLLASHTDSFRVVSRAAPLPPFDVHAPLLSLPGILHTRLETIPAQVPYLWANAESSEFWRRQLEPLAGCRVGIAWQGHPTNPDDRQRSIALAGFAALAGVEGIRLVSLQVNDGLEQVSTAGFDISNAGPNLNSFADTAGLMANLDLVVTVDTAVAHLAGALGRPVWVLLPPFPDWRWLLDRDDSPWYPTMRLFRQGANEDWAAVFGRVAEELRRFLQ